jgi:pimeloyl-ACP methyl ester carboxylesterase
MLRKTVAAFVAAGLLLVASALAAQDTAPASPATQAESGYVDVNGLHMYYEVHGQGKPLVLLHGAYMNIDLMGDLIGRLAETRQVIAVEMQGHGRTGDIDRPMTYEALADDVAALMDAVGVGRADIFGYSMGGNVALRLAMRYPELVDRIVVASAAYNSSGYPPGFEEMVAMMTPDMFAGTPVVSEYERLAPDPDGFATLVEKLKQLDLTELDWPADDIRAIAAPTLLIAGDSDTVTLEHIVELFRLRGGGVNGDITGLPQSQLAIIPGASHISVMFNVDLLVPMVVSFLDGTGVQTPAM